MSSPQGERHEAKANPPQPQEEGQQQTVSQFLREQRWCQPAEQPAQKQQQQDASMDVVSQVPLLGQLPGQLQGQSLDQIQQIFQALGAAPPQQQGQQQFPNNGINQANMAIAASLLKNLPPPQAPQAQQNSMGSVVVPCRARRMPLDHNYKSAYFIIPSDAKHGAELMCSYPACRYGGVKFRYCSHCMAPVARRNFRKRHHHNEAVPVNRGARQIKSNSIPTQVTVKSDEGRKREAVKPMPNPEPKPSAAVSSGSVGTGSTRRAVSESPSESNETKAEKPRAKAPLSVEESEKLREARWTQLIAERPHVNDSDGMIAWIDEIMAVSNLEVGYVPGRRVIPTSSSNDEYNAEAAGYSNDATENPSQDKGYAECNVYDDSDSSSGGSSSGNPSGKECG